MGDLAALAPRIGRPEQRRRRDALAAVEGRAGGDAWEALVAQGLIDAGWASDPRRWFCAGDVETCPDCRGRGAVGGAHGEDNEWEDASWTCARCDTTGRVARASEPRRRPSSSEALVLGSDPEGVARAEELAWTVAARVALWGAPSAERLVWRLGGPLRQHQPLDILVKHMEPLRDLFVHIWEVVVEEDPGLGRRDGFFRRAAWQLRLEALWRAAASRGCTIPARYSILGITTELSACPLVGRALASVPNPFEPLVALWGTGYVLDEISDGAIVLIAPTGAA